MLIKNKQTRKTNRVQIENISVPGNAQAERLWLTKKKEKEKKEKGRKNSAEL